MRKKIQIQTESLKGFVDITDKLQQIVRESGVQEGMMFLYCPHTSCGLTIQENFDPGVQEDMLLVLNRLVPLKDPDYQHVEDNSASHLQSSMMGANQFLFIEDGALMLGRWQAIYLCEFDGPRERTVAVKVQADR